MQLHAATPQHLLLAALYLSESDREEMDRIEAGRNPVDVLLAAMGDPGLHAITDTDGTLLAVGGTHKSIIWFVHTQFADALPGAGKLRMFRLLEAHLRTVLATARKRFPHADRHFTNVVSKANRKHVKLLKALGAEFTQVHNVNGHEFHQFFF